MRIITGFLIALLSAGCAGIGKKPMTPIADKLPAAPAGTEWRLVWNDEFDGKDLDESKWDVPEFRRRDAQWSRRAILLDGKGNLVLKVFKEGSTYYDGCARTRGKYEKAFGYFTARVKFHKYAGHWPAFWLYSESVNDAGDEGRNGTEVDIMEKPTLDDKVQHNLHWNGYGKEHKTAGLISTIPGVMEGFHDFGLNWTPDEYVFYVDGVEVWRTRAGGVCQVPLYIKLSDEIKFGDWAGDIRESTVPDETLVDHVRVYDLFGTDGKPVYAPK